MQDLWQLANVAGLGPSEQMRKDMMKRHSKAHSEDRRKVVQGPEMTTEDVLHGKDTDQDESCYTKATAKSIDAIRVYFEGRTLRRTLRSKGHDKSTILDMPDPCEVVALLKLHPHEVRVLELAAADALEHSRTDVRRRSVRQFTVIYSHSLLLIL